MKDRTMIPIERETKDRLKILCAQLKIRYSDFISLTLNPDIIKRLKK